jgi:hypothetical protein
MKKRVEFKLISRLLLLLDLCQLGLHLLSLGGLAQLCLCLIQGFFETGLLTLSSVLQEISGLNFCLFDHLSCRGTEIAVKILILVDFKVYQLSLCNLLATEPVRCFAQSVVVYQVLHVDVLLLAVGKGAHASPAAGEFVVSSQITL